MGSLVINWENVNQDELKQVDRYFIEQPDDNESDSNISEASLEQQCFQLASQASYSSGKDLDLFSGSEGYSDWLSNDNDPVSTLIEDDIDIDGEYTSKEEYGGELAADLGTPQSEYHEILDGMRMSFGEEDEEKIFELGAGLHSPDNFSATRNPNLSCEEDSHSQREESGNGLGTATSPLKKTKETKNTSLGRKRSHHGTIKRKYSEVVSSEYAGQGRIFTADNNKAEVETMSGETSMRGEESRMGMNHHDLEQDRAKFKPHSIKASIFQVLEEAGPAGLQVSQIVEITQERGMKDWRGVLTPKCTVSASCSTDPVFVRVAPGTFALRALLDKDSIPVVSTVVRKRKRIRTSYKQYV